MRFNLFWDVKVPGVAGISKFSRRLIRMHTATKSFERFLQPKSVDNEVPKSTAYKTKWSSKVFEEWKQNWLVKSCTLEPGGLLPRNKHWTRPLQICLNAVSTTGCRSSFKKQAILWLGALFFPFVVLNSLRTEAHLSDVNGSAALNSLDMSDRR